MPSWLLALSLLGVWCLWAVAAAARRAAEDARRGVPEGERGGVSIFPVIPVFPALLWGLAWLVDRAVEPWGSWAVGLAHGGFAACLAGSIVRDWRRLRSPDDAAGRGR